jgi:outer membrane lipoprotein-sorting protein
MQRFVALALAFSAPAALHAQAAPAGLAQVQAHLRAVDTMTAGFTQSDRRGRTLSGTLTIRRPGRVRLRLWAQRQHADRRRRPRVDLHRL